MTDRYENIRRALEMGPTPGPWKWWEHEDFGYCWVNPRYGGLWIAKCDVRDPFDQEQRANAALIAACDPDTIRELLVERDVLARENEAMRRCAIKYLGWLGVTHKPLDAALREDMANPDMCGDAALNPTAAQENDDA